MLDIFSQESFFKVRQYTAPLFLVGNLINWTFSSYRSTVCAISTAACTHKAAGLHASLQVGGAVVVFLVLFFVFVIGPPDS